jgi:hypothetical protein
MNLELERERTVQVLCAHYAHDHLTTQELEERCERAYAADSPDVLRTLVDQLPALPLTPDAEERLYALSAAAAVEPAQRMLAFMSSVRREGEWTPPRYLHVSAFMGAVHLDLREAFLSGDMTINVKTTMGEVKILVPPGVRVESTGNAILGEFDQRGGGTPVPVDAPVVRVTGTSIMGTVSIRVRLPRESALAAWRRERRLGPGKGKGKDGEAG